MGTIMKNKTIRTFALQATVALSLVASSYANAAQLLNSSYDIARELFTQLNSDFKTQWDAQHPDDKVTIKQSHAGSSKQALAILQGLPADVVTYNQVTDVQILHDKGKLIPADWQQRLPNNSSPYYSTMAYLVRKGNPKNITEDLQPGGINYQVCDFTPGGRFETDINRLCPPADTAVIRAA